MANYPQYNYQPQQMGTYGQQMMQPVYQQPMYQPMQAVQEQPLVCRMVTSADEARGVPVDFSGRPMTFLNLPKGTIYVKAFNPGTGAADFAEFRRVETQEPEPQQAGEAFAPMSVVKQLEETVTKLQEDLKALRAAKRSRVQEAVDNDE